MVKSYKYLKLACMAIVSVACTAVVFTAICSDAVRASYTDYDTSEFIVGNKGGCNHVPYEASGSISLPTSVEVNRYGSDYGALHGLSNMRVVGGCTCAGVMIQCSDSDGSARLGDSSILGGGVLHNGDSMNLHGSNATISLDGLGKMPGSEMHKTIHYYACAGDGRGVHLYDTYPCPDRSALYKDEIDRLNKQGISYYSCYESTTTICIHRNYPTDGYWFVYVTAKADRPVARPGEQVNFTYTANFYGTSPSWGGAPGTEAEGTAALSNSSPVTIHMDTGGITQTETVVGAPGQVFTWHQARIATQADVGHDVVGTITAYPSSWRCKKHGECSSVSAKDSFTVHYNWDDQLKSERKVISDKWHEPKPYGVEVVNAYPNDYVTFKHTANLKYVYDEYQGHTRYYTLTNAPIDYYDHNNLLGKRWVKQWPTGVMPGVPQPPIVEGYVKDFHHPMPVTYNNVNTTMCEHISARPAAFKAFMIPHNQNGTFESERSSRDACVHFPYHYTPENPGDPGHGPAPRTCAFRGDCPNNEPPKGLLPGGINPSVKFEHSPVLLGDPFTFYSTLTHNGGRTQTKPFHFREYIAIVDGDAITSERTNGPLIYSGRSLRNPGFDCDPALGRHGRGPVHRIPFNNIRKCYQLCGSDSSIVRTPCKSDRAPLYPDEGNREDRDTRTGDYNVRIFNDARPRPGDKICYWTAVTDWSAIDDVSANSVIVSNMSCIDIAKQPQLKVIGGEIIANGDITGSNYNKVNPYNNYRGSWAQYGLFANGKIADFGSAGFSMAAEVNQVKGCRLAYANQIGLSGSTGTSCSAEGLGSFGMASDNVTGIYTPKVPEVDRKKAEKLSNPEVDLSKYRGGDQKALIYDGAGPLNIHGTLATGVRLVIRVTNKSTVTRITEDVATKDKDFRVLSDIPSFTLITDGDIDILSKVSTIFGNYITRNAKKHIHTCAEMRDVKVGVYQEGLGVSKLCNAKSLKVQGSLISEDNISFNRTAGSENFDYKGHHDDKIRAIPSEEIDYTPNTFLMPYYSSYKFDDNTRFVIRTANSILPRY